MTRPILARLAYVALAVLTTATVFGGLASLKASASRGDLPVLQWGGER